jgi:predicted Zn finger-like uncharacterized protein
MLIECPFCHARARLSEDKEGAKVRCGECGKVYRARESLAAGRRPAPRKSQTGIAIAIGAAVVLAIVAWVAMRSGASDPTPVRAASAATEPEPEISATTDPTGFESAPVQAAVRAHTLAAAGNAASLELHLYGPLLEQPSGDLPADVDLGPLEDAWRTLSHAEKSAALGAAVASLTDKSEAGTVAGWTPYDGEVTSEGDALAVVQLSATPAGGGTTKRTIEWRLAKQRGEWKPWAWSEWVSESDEQGLDRGYDIVELSDGSVVVEREPEPLGHLDDTPDDVRERLDELVPTMLDLSLTRQASQAGREVIAIGKPAIPLLLTHLYENKLYTREDSIRANIAVSALREITGQYFGYQPQSLVGGALGATEERRQSSIRQWFAWWYRKADTFTGPEPPAPGEE